MSSVVFAFVSKASEMFEFKWLALNEPSRSHHTTISLQIQPCVVRLHLTGF